MNFCIDCGTMVQYDDDSHHNNRELTINISKHLLERIIYETSQDVTEQLMVRVTDALIKESEGTSCYRNECDGKMVKNELHNFYCEKCESVKTTNKCVNCGKGFVKHLNGTCDFCNVASDDKIHSNCPTKCSKCNMKMYLISEDRFKCSGCGEYLDKK